MAAKVPMWSIIVATCGGRSETMPCFKVKPVNVRGSYFLAEIAAMEASQLFSETSFSKDMKPRRFEIG